MSSTLRKFVAIWLLLWLPLFSASALAASVSMQMPQGGYARETVASPALTGMEEGGEHCQHAGLTAAEQKQTPSCNACGVCHLACTAYLAVPAVELFSMQTTARETTPYLFAFHSVSSTPLLPPPLARV